MNYLAERSDISLLFTDVVMPGGMSGYELAELAVVAYPELHILLTSGYVDTTVSHSGMKQFQGQLITKPYTQTELAQRVRTVLGESVATNENNVAEMVEKVAVDEKSVVWSDALSLGIESIDDDHKILLEQVNKCYQISVGGDGDLGEILNNLKDYTTVHFAREEKVMEACGYPGLANHRQVHRLLVKQLLEQRQQYEKGKLDAHSLLTFLQSWLIDHIQTMDRAYAPYCEGNTTALNGSLMDTLGKKS